MLVQHQFVSKVRLSLCSKHAKNAPDPGVYIPDYESAEVMPVLAEVSTISISKQGQNQEQRAHFYTGVSPV